MQVGAVSSILGRVVFRVSEGLFVRSVARCGTTGIDCELGLGKQWSSMMSTYCCAVHGFLGTTVKLKIVRAGHAIEVPIILSKEYDDWTTMLAAYVLPPLFALVIRRCATRDHHNQCFCSS